MLQNHILSLVMGLRVCDKKFLFVSILSSPKNVSATVSLLNTVLTGSLPSEDLSVAPGAQCRLTVT